jgi:hypothetical protein
MNHFGTESSSVADPTPQGKRADWRIERRDSKTGSFTVPLRPPPRAV